MRFTSRTSEEYTGCCLRKLRLRFADFFARLWLFIALRRRSLPVPVTLNRFFAALFLFCSGISVRSWILRCDSGVLGRPEQHAHVAPIADRRWPDVPALLDVLS